MRGLWLLVGLVITLQGLATAQGFRPPRVIGVINQSDSGDQTEEIRSDRRYLIDRGIETSIYRGDVLNVYRETRLSRRMPVCVSRPGPLRRAM